MQVHQGFINAVLLKGKVISIGKHLEHKSHIYLRTGVNQEHYLEFDDQLLTGLSSQPKTGDSLHVDGHISSSGVVVIDLLHFIKPIRRS